MGCLSFNPVLHNSRVIRSVSEGTMDVKRLLSVLNLNFFLSQMNVSQTLLVYFSSQINIKAHRLAFRAVF